jgi:endonuclease YncB( thermonuclease family)
MKWLACCLLCWTVTATVVRTIDGDTADIRADIWPGLTVSERIRVLDIDTPEKRKANWVEYLQATAFTRAWLERGPFQIHVCKRDFAGRLLAIVSREGEVLADRLREAGHVKR